MERASSVEPIFECGPLRWLKTRLGLFPLAVRGAVRAALVTWAPLLILSLVEGARSGWDSLRSFGLDLGVHTRLLIALPVLVAAEAFVVPRLEGLCRQFRVAGLVRDEEVPRFDAAIASTRRLRDSILASLGVAILAWGSIPWLLATRPALALPEWTHHAGDPQWTFTPAGWWVLLVSLPLLLATVLGWGWRLVLWARLLVKLSRLDLGLVPAHPDRAAGLMFVAYSLRAFSVLGFGGGCIIAGGIANSVILEDVPMMQYRYVIAGAVGAIVVGLTLPLLAFSARLIVEWRRGVAQYGALAVAVGQRFERKWFPRQGSIDDGALEVPDFSAQTDLYQIVANVYQMRMAPVDLGSILYLATASLAPFVPVLLASVPFDEVLEAVARLVL